MPKRIAITIAGAVSLGSYEAGVLYELLEAIRKVNEAATDEASKIYIDVITGASAGAMTAAMVAERLMFDGQSLQNEFTNPLYEAWVERISLLGLARMRWKERKWHSLFSSDLVESIGRDMLVNAMQSKATGPHPAVECIGGVPQPLRVGIALTNLNGINYMIPIVGSDEGGFNYTSSLSQKIFEIRPESASDPKLWQDLCDAAVGSGAFPVAFRPKAIQHSVEEFGERVPEPPELCQQGNTYVDWTGPSPGTFAHSDGGVLQNQPLGIAKNLVDVTVSDREVRLGPAAHCDSSDRLYVFVAPHSVKSTAERFRAESVTIWEEIKHLFSVYTRQAMFHDWITAEGVNQKVDLLDVRAKELASVIITGKLDIEALSRTAQSLNALLMSDEEAGRLARLREQYSVEYKEVLQATGHDSAEAFISGIATLEAAAHLEGRDKMNIVAVIADQKELAGAGLAAFVGFFKKSYRQHDYWVGRRKTREYLQRKDVKAVLGIRQWPDDENWGTPLSNPTTVALPLKKWEVAWASVVPASVMVLIRPALVAALFLLIGIFLLAIWYVHRM